MRVGKNEERTNSPKIAIESKANVCDVGGKETVFCYRRFTAGPLDAVYLHFWGRDMPDSMYRRKGWKAYGVVKKICPHFPWLDTKRKRL